MNRKMFTWDVVLQSSDGQTIQRKFRSFWSPQKDNITSQSVAEAAAAMETVAAKGPKYAGISAQLADE